MRCRINGAKIHLASLREESLGAKPGVDEFHEELSAVGPESAWRTGRDQSEEFMCRSKYLVREKFKVCLRKKLIANF